MPGTAGAVSPDKLGPLQRHFRVEVRNEGRAAILTLHGEFDLASVPEFERELAGAAASELLVVDLKQLDFIDSTGLGALVKAHQQAQEAGREFALVKGGGQVERLLGLTGLTDQLQIAETQEELLSR